MLDWLKEKFTPLFNNIKKAYQHLMESPSIISNQTENVLNKPLSDQDLENQTPAKVSLVTFETEKFLIRLEHLKTLSRIQGQLDCIADVKDIAPLNLNNAIFFKTHLEKIKRTLNETVPYQRNGAEENSIETQATNLNGQINIQLQAYENYITTLSDSSAQGHLQHDKKQHLQIEALMNDIVILKEQNAGLNLSLKEKDDKLKEYENKIQMLQQEVEHNINEKQKDDESLCLDKPQLEKLNKLLHEKIYELKFEDSQKQKLIGEQLQTIKQHLSRVQQLEKTIKNLELEIETLTINNAVLEKDFTDFRNYTTKNIMEVKNKSFFFTKSSMTDDAASHYKDFSPKQALTLLNKYKVLFMNQTSFTNNLLLECILYQKLNVRLEKELITQGQVEKKYNEARSFYENKIAELDMEWRVSSIKKGTTNDNEANNTPEENNKLKEVNDAKQKKIGLEKELETINNSILKTRLEIGKAPVASAGYLDKQLRYLEETLGKALEEIAAIELHYKVDVKNLIETSTVQVDPQAKTRLKGLALNTPSRSTPTTPESTPPSTPRMRASSFDNTPPPPTATKPLIILTGVVNKPRGLLAAVPQNKLPPKPENTAPNTPEAGSQNLESFSNSVDNI